jgi:NhaA family Na+:H+ antiporter
MDRIRPPLPLPKALVVVIRPFQAFFRTSSASGIVLLGATILAMVWANSRFAGIHHRIFGERLAVQVAEIRLHWPVHEWINDGLMAIFFFLVGMEIKRELVVGELRTFRRAILPAFAAIGGMVVPAALYHVLNRHGPGRPGWGIPMATDIAFALGCLAVVRSRVAPSLAVFLTALAIFDDLGAILVIAIFYGQPVQTYWLGAAGVIVALLVVLNLYGVRKPAIYGLVGVALWYVVLRSGVHATIAGVILGLSIPARTQTHPKAIIGELESELEHLRHAMEGEADQDEGNAALRAIERHLEDVQPPLNRLTHALHAPVSFLVIPLFALANAGISFAHTTKDDLLSPISLGVGLGLFFGKQVGVFLFTWLGVVLKISPPLERATWRQIYGVAILAGIGFTMSLFISGLAFADPGAAHGAESTYTEAAKIGILAASTLSAIVGLLVLLSGPKLAVPEGNGRGHG